MPPFLISLLLKLGPYAAVALIALGLGGYAAHRLDLGTIQTEKLALAQQQTLDASVTADWNKKAADFHTEIATLQADARTARMAERQGARSATETQLAAQDAQAAQAGQDAPSAPVLLAARAYLAGAGK